MPDFEEIYGKPVDEMTDGEFKVAVLGFLHGIDKRLIELNGKTKCIPRHQTYFKIMGIVSSVVFAGVIGYLIKMVFHA